MPTPTRDKPASLLESTISSTLATLNRDQAVERLWAKDRRRTARR